MLISCPECASQISDKAISCPRCGYPINQQTVIISTQPKKTRSHMKLPNGFGSIKKLSGNRRKPYAAYPPLRQCDYDDNGKPPKLKAFGFFETWYEAYDCLAKYNGNYVKSKTFSEVYQEWFDKKVFNSLRPIADNTKKGYEATYSSLSALYEMPISTIVTSNMQDIVNEKFKTKPSAAISITKLLNQIFKYALQEGYIATNYAQYVVKPTFVAEQGIPFDLDELKNLWDNADSKDVQIALILIYSGLRKGELKAANIDLENMVFEGGLKTTAGKTRVVPIHPLIQDFVKSFNQNKYNPNSYCSNKVSGFSTVKKLCNLKESNKHTSHDCRHTFSWLCDKYNVDEISKHLLMGHSLGKDVEKNVYGHRTLDELRTEIYKIQKF